MISYLEGKIIAKRDSFIILKINGVGYKIFMEPNFYYALKEGDNKVKVFCFPYFKENLQELYGFDSLEKLIFFENLVNLPGIGPKVALRLSSFGSFENLIKALKEGKVAIPGLGSKKIQRLQVELLGAVKRERKEKEEKNKDLKLALESMGFEKKEIKKAISQIPENLPLEEKIKLALKKISS